MASLANQRQCLLKNLHTAQTIFDGFAEGSSGKARQELQHLYGQWVKEKLSEASRNIASIDIEKVLALREAKQTTEPVFEEKIDAAVECLTNDNGVKYSINKLFEHKVDYSADEIQKLGRVLRLTDKVLHRIAIFRSSILSLLTSGWVWVGILLLALLTIPVYRYGEVYLQSTDSSQRESIHMVIATQVEKDIGAIHDRAMGPNKSIIERSAKVVKAVWDITDTIPKIVNTLVAAWGFVLLWLRR